MLQTLVANFASLAASWWFTLKITFGALAWPARRRADRLRFALSRGIERALFPIAVVLQVTPVVAIAPLILIYVQSTTAALLLCAWIVAFFPILSNTVIGLRCADANLKDLFRLYRATPWQRLRLLLVPSAPPYFIAGLKVSGGLSLIGAVTAEMVAGAAGARPAWPRASSKPASAPRRRRCSPRCCCSVLTGVLIFWSFEGAGAGAARPVACWRAAGLKEPARCHRVPARCSPPVLFAAAPRSRRTR